ncbi:division/cell wall cluster transcriptional repressor MraZ [Desulfobacula sp.]|uniref:division/cell wall cluster transcriptional repressor MraZ n=1 Tax=Desulfobacula sp. TaxID=2593537 RepID=UPI0025BA6843|nr:division/cell wall cluster transcriptional repressor MraZ [Desulfobacula sp.]MBC2704632.1 division/cell wall cluster transcriptional repressor MraZ [Desulfobacula sp.]MCK4767470.1 division/cell wall cluster transcriptional repressor MraZ [Desulfobacula sp.]
MFRSSSFHTIDSKGRVIIPSRFRNILKADKIYGVMVSNKDDCLYAYTFSEWEKVETRILATKTSAMGDFRRFFLGNSCDCMCDKQDRILIPKSLREYANLEKDIVLVGNLDRFEIWARGHWDKVNKRMEQKLKNEEVREEIASLGL